MKLAVIGCFAGKHDNTFALLHRVLVGTTRVPDEFWVMCEDEDDLDCVYDALYDLDKLEVEYPEAVLRLVLLPTPRGETGFEKIPYSNKINYALDKSEADVFVYLDNDSMPSPEKYGLMEAALEENPEWGAVYVGQKRTGWNNMVFNSNLPVPSAFCVLNFTQVMHRKTDARWTLDMAYANPDVADGIFWRDLHKVFGWFYPVDEGKVHDEHHMPSVAAQGI
jgi:cellulose synthase/poly-beta-1,6-N-acetylglucosamine synthase-like glycosyltransferase